MEDLLLSLTDVKIHFPVHKGSLMRRKVGVVKAVDGISLSVRRGEVLGLVGESGCGKTTVARTVLKLLAPTAGKIRFDGDDIWTQNAVAEKAYRRRVQAVFQDPMSSLNPRMRIEEIVAEPLIVHEIGGSSVDRRHAVYKLLDLCGLPRRFAELYPHEMSGGQRQRVGIARALALRPDMVVCDEAVSALDVSIQAQVINLLADLQSEFGLTYLFIGHDLSVVRHLCDRVAVMYLGQITEIATSEALFAKPKHPYARALLEAVPIPDPEAEEQRAHRELTGEVPSPLDPPPGCVFHPRCPLAMDICRRDRPILSAVEDGHRAACFAVEGQSA